MHPLEPGFAGPSEGRLLMVAALGDNYLLTGIDLWRLALDSGYGNERQRHQHGPERDRQVVRAAGAERRPPPVVTLNPIRMGPGAFPPRRPDPSRGKSLAPAAG